MEIVAAELAVTALASLAFGSVALIHGLRGVRNDIRTSLLIAGGVWAGIAMCTKLLLPLLVSTICVR
jgi:hypothetical protein